MFDNQIGIFINGCLNLFHVVCLYVGFLSKYKFGIVPIKFRHSTFKISNIRPPSIDFPSPQVCIWEVVAI